MAAADAAADAAKLSVSFQAFAALLDCCAAAGGDCDGILFGRAALPPSFPDDDPAPTLPIYVTGHSSLARRSVLSNALDCFKPYSPARPGTATVGFFSSRRSAWATRRPSMREAAVARSLSKSLALTHPVVFLLLAPSVASDLSIHSFDHRAFLLVDSRLVPTSLTIVNVGPRYRGQYQCHTFAPESPMPWLPPPPANIGEQSTEEEEMYSGMLRRLERLAQEAEEGNKRLLRQENKNLLGRRKFAWLK
ncbi:uncharacterized protein [Aegilops tauschii subsp. strangulata]|nr:uncharacterized protein LOC109752275 [Aegilops tauschii subsp. strangulata]